MTWEECFAHHLPNLSQALGAREARSVMRIIKEDFFGFEQGFPKSELSSTEVYSMESVVHRVILGEPIQYAIGTALFDGMKLKVSPDVLIPRPETEELLYWAKELMVDSPDHSYLDIGTGSGCLALGLKKYFPKVRMHALDKSRKALAIATGNAAKFELPVKFHELDILDRSWWDEFPMLEGIVSNPPYIPHKELELMGQSVVKHEPEMALKVPNDDPLRFYKAIGAFGKSKIQSKGFLLVEVNEFFAQETKSLLESLNYDAVELRNDMSGRPRMCLGYNLLS